MCVLPDREPAEKRRGIALPTQDMLAAVDDVILLRSIEDLRDAVRRVASTGSPHREAAMSPARSLLSLYEREAHRRGLL